MIGLIQQMFFGKTTLENGKTISLKYRVLWVLLSSGLFLYAQTLCEFVFRNNPDANVNLYVWILSAVCAAAVVGYILFIIRSLNEIRNGDYLFRSITGLPPENAFKVGITDEEN